MVDLLARLPAPLARPDSPAGMLGDEIRVMIAQDGPISVARYMALALGHPTGGYYMTRDPFGSRGDFTTAPEISQMFGELLGVWAAEVWHGMGRPDPVRLVELGPGRGTLMSDLWRAAAALPFFQASLDIHLVETSPVLRATQQRALAARGIEARWHGTVDSVPDGPAIVLANEFFDALPIRQFISTARGWCERLVGLDAGGNLVFGVAMEPEHRVSKVAAEGAVIEVNEAAIHIMTELAARLAKSGGALLAIDYGPLTSTLGDTLQAVKQHRFVDPLADPGEADLTAHVDFATLARAALGQGAGVHGPVTQGSFLRELGIEQRAEALKRRATPLQATEIEAALARLASPDPGMGKLFKVMAATHPLAPVPPGFALERRS